MASAEDHATVETQIRKYRKKLRQIEHLLSVRRTLTEEEKKKVCLKSTLRKELQHLLKQVVDVSKALPEAPGHSKSSHEATHLKRPENDNSQIHVEDIMKRSSTSRDEDEGTTNNHNEEKQNLQNEGKRLKQEDGGHADHGINGTAENRQKKSRDTRNVPDSVQDDFKHFARSKVVCRYLEGHGDIVWSVAADKDYIISGSRDTTAKIWDIATGEEICSLRGHTDSVNAVCLLTIEQSEKFLLETNLKISSKRIALTASCDCQIKVWALPTGENLKSVYTFNNITCMGLMSEPFHLILGTDGGKVEVWNIMSGCALQSVTAHNDAISCVEVSDLQVCTGAQDGTVKIWLFRDDMLQVIYTLDPNLDITNPTKKLKQLKCISSQNGRLFLGDEGTNIKVLTWRRGKISQIRNHCQKYGCTDSIKIHQNLLASSSYNLDTGLGSIHFRILPESRYLCSFPENTDRIRCLAIADSANENCEYTVVTGGAQLLIWYIIDSTKKDTWKRYNALGDCDVLDVSYLPDMVSEPVISSSEDEITDDDDDESSFLDDSSTTKTDTVSSEVVKSGWSWCSLL